MPWIARCSERFHCLCWVYIHSRAAIFFMFTKFWLSAPIWPPYILFGLNWRVNTCSFKDIEGLCAGPYASSWEIQRCIQEKDISSCLHWTLGSYVNLASLVPAVLSSPGCFWHYFPLVHLLFHLVGNFLTKSLNVGKVKRSLATHSPSPISSLSWFVLLLVCQSPQTSPSSLCSSHLKLCSFYLFCFLSGFPSNPSTMPTLEQLFIYIFFFSPEKSRGSFPGYKNTTIENRRYPPPKKKM